MGCNASRSKPLPTPPNPYVYATFFHNKESCNFCKDGEAIISLQGKKLLCLGCLHYGTLRMEDARCKSCHYGNNSRWQCGNCVKLFEDVRLRLLESHLAAMTGNAAIV